MSGFEQTTQAGGPEQSAADFVERYTGFLGDAVERCLQGADLILEHNDQGLGELLEQEDGWTDQELVVTLNATSSSVGKLLRSAHAEVDNFLEGNHQQALNTIPDEDRWLWELIEGQIGRSGLGSEEVEAFYGSASSPTAASVMKIACNYPLWLFINGQQGRFAETVFRPEMRDFAATASHPEVVTAMNVGLDFLLWRGISAHAIKHDGPDYPSARSTEDASDERIKHAMDAGLDYQVATAVFRRRDDYDRRGGISRSIKSALEYATAPVCQILEDRLGNKYTDRYEESWPTEKERDEYMKEIVEEAAASFGGEPYELADLLQRVANIMDGRAPADDFGSGEDFFDFEDFASGAGESSVVVTGPDPYEVLGVDRDADGLTIKAAFRKLVHEHHPDKGGQVEMAQKIILAYETLSNPRSRAHYDQFSSTSGL